MMRWTWGLVPLLLLAAPVKRWFDPCCARVQATTVDGSRVYTRASVDSAVLRDGRLRVYPRSRVDSVVPVCLDGYVVDVSPASLTIVDGETDSLTATVTNCGRTVQNARITWTSRTTSVVASPSGTGTRVGVTGLQVGSSYLVASEGGASDSALVSVTPTPSTCDVNTTSLQFIGQFEQPDPWDRMGRNEGDVAAHSHTHNTVDSLVNECEGSVRFELRKSDPREGTKWRTELKMGPDSVNGAIPGPLPGGPGAETWMGWSIYVPSDFVAETAGGVQETVTQIKACTSGRSPMWEIQIDKLTFEMFTRFGAAGSLRTVMAGAFPITRGAWHHFVLHGKWRSDNTGVLEGWVKVGDPGDSEADYTKFVNRQNTPTVWSDCSNQLDKYKFGIYKWSWKTEAEGGDNSIVSVRVLYFDNFRITNGTHGSFTVVKPR